MCRTATLALPPLAESPRRARRFLLERLWERGWRPDVAGATLTDQGQLVLTELVTNALRHARGQMQIRIEAHQDRLTLSVTDSVRPTGPLTPQHVGPASQSGRGLIIVDTLSSAWGVQEELVGKTVWAQLPVPPSSWPANPCRDQNRSDSVERPK